MTQKSTKIIAVMSAIVFLVCMSMTVIGFIVVTKQKEVYFGALKKKAESEAREISEKSLTVSLEKTKNERALLSSQILKDTNVIGLLSLIESLGKEQGVDLKTSSLNVEKIDQKFETLVVNLEVVGPYSSVTQILNLLEHIPYQATISSVQLERVEEGANGKWKGMFTLKVTKFKKNET